LNPDEGAQMLRHLALERQTQQPDESKPRTPSATLDDWYLLRLQTGRAGWVLSNGVYSAIPEEVAQCAERKRIISYFPLGEPDDREAEAHRTWLWTQVTGPNQPYDFDLVRVFIWSKQRQTYQTARLDRGLRGYLPVILHDRVEADRSSGPGFSLILNNKKGERVQRKYAVLRNRVVQVSEQPAPPPPAAIKFAVPEPQPAPPTMMEQLLSWWKKQ
jgi:hypothetical protein